MTKSVRGRNIILSHFDNCSNVYAYNSSKGTATVKRHKYCQESLVGANSISSTTSRSLVHRHLPKTERQTTLCGEYFKKRSEMDVYRHVNIYNCKTCQFQYEKSSLMEVISCSRVNHFIVREQNLRIVFLRKSISITKKSGRKVVFVLLQHKILFFHFFTAWLIFSEL